MKLRIRGVPKRLTLTWKLQPAQPGMSCELSYQHTHTSGRDARGPLSGALGLPTQTETFVRLRQQNSQNRKTGKRKSETEDTREMLGSQSDNTSFSSKTPPSLSPFSPLLYSKEGGLLHHLLNYRRLRQ